MREIENIKKLQHRAFSGRAWHGPSLEEIIRDIPAEQAAAEPVLGEHSIWQHVLHMIFWKDNLTHALRGAPMPGSSQVIQEEDWPTVSDPSEEAWQNTVKELRASEDRLQRAMAELPEERLGETVRGRDYDFYFALQSIPNHDIYHAAQIALLKKSGTPRRSGRVFSDKI